ncbi:hypothetical protein B0H16DRAFT_1694540 [Mycena metata]|uniref:Uncharacterized protein n=1 Tax=Mycena metata TaxID=1033252 RepID=A0AAD7MZK4_9AGAR|nr:hypothetical protein B0H16DRAFT_1694540 [Mycena metata]
MAGEIIHKIHSVQAFVGASNEADPYINAAPSPSPFLLGKKSSSRISAFNLDPLRRNLVSTPRLSFNSNKSSLEAFALRFTLIQFYALYGFQVLPHSFVEMAPETNSSTHGRKQMNLAILVPKSREDKSSLEGTNGGANCVRREVRSHRSPRSFQPLGPVDCVKYDSLAIRTRAEDAVRAAGDFQSCRDRVGPPPGTRPVQQNACKNYITNGSQLDGPKAIPYRGYSTAQK